MKSLLIFFYVKILYILCLASSLLKQVFAPLSNEEHWLLSRDFFSLLAFRQDRPTLYNQKRIFYERMATNIINITVAFRHYYLLGEYFNHLFLVSHSDYCLCSTKLLSVSLSSQSTNSESLAIGLLSNNYEIFREKSMGLIFSN